MASRQNPAASRRRGIMTDLNVCITALFEDCSHWLQGIVNFYEKFWTLAHQYLSRAENGLYFRAFNIQLDPVQTSQRQSQNKFIKTKCADEESRSSVSRRYRVHGTESFVSPQPHQFGASPDRGANQLNIPMLVELNVALEGFEVLHRWLDCNDSAAWANTTSRQ